MSVNAAGAIEFRLLGPLECRVAGRRLRIAGARQERILAILLIHAGRVVSADSLAAVAWDDERPPTARRQVQNSIAALRRQFSGAGIAAERIATDGPGYSIRVSRQEIDTKVFGDRVDEARRLVSVGDLPSAVERLRSALSLWRGPALAGMRGPLLEASARRLDESRLDALEECVELELAQGAGNELVAELYQTVIENPLRERIVGQLMIALYRSGRQAEALAEYERLRGRLAEELGIAPGPQLQQVHYAVLRNEVMPLEAVDSAEAKVFTAGAPAPVVPAQLPGDIASFTGRTALLVQFGALLDRCQDSSAPVRVAISGGAGVGKTALAVHWAHRIKERYPDGQLYVALRGYSHGRPMTSAEALDLLLLGLGVVPERMPATVDEKVGLYRSLLANRRVLVLLDDARSSDQASSLLPSSPGSLAVITSRDQIKSLTALHDAHQVTLGALRPDEAHDLLRRVLGPEQVEAEPDACAELVALCGHLPLALRIAGANIVGPPQWTVSQYVAILRANGIDELALDGDPDLAVTAALRRSYEALEPDARKLFRLAGFAPGTDITPAATAALVDVDPARAGRVLRRLATAHLIEQHLPGRFRFHDLIRQYAAQVSADEDSADGRGAGLHRVLAFYQQSTFAATALAAPGRKSLDRDPPSPEAQALSFTDAAQARAWLDQETSNLTAVVEYVANHGPRHIAWQMADAMYRHFWVRRSPTNWINIARAAVRAAIAEEEPAAEAVVRNHLGVSYWSTSQYADAVEQFEASLKINERIGRRRGVAGVLANMGGVYREMGDLDSCLKYSSAGVSLFMELGEQLGEANTRITVGGVCSDLGRLDEAVGHADRAATIYRELGNLDGEGSALLLLGIANRQLGHFDEALTYCRAAIRAFDAVEATQGRACALELLAATLIDMGDAEQAESHVTEALTLVRDGGHRISEAEVLATLATARHETGRSEEAVLLYDEAVNTARAIGGRLPELVGLIGRARARLGLGELQGAHDDSAAALDLAREGGYHLLESQALVAEAEIHLRGGRPVHAVAASEEALAGLNSAGCRLWQARAHRTLGDAHAAKGDGDAAETHRREASRLYTALGVAESGGLGECGPPGDREDGGPQPGTSSRY